MIIILTQCFPPRIGGIENLIENLSLELSKHHDVLVLADQNDNILDKLYDDKLKNKLKIKRIGGIKFLRKRRKLKELKKIINKNKVLCVIGDSWKSFESTINFINLSSVNSICLAHGNELIVKSQRHRSRIISVMNKMSHIVCNSHFTINLVKQIGIVNEEISSIHPGAQNNINLTEEIIENLNGKPILVTLARLEKRKGHKFVLSAIANLKNKYPNIQYVIAGSGNELNKLKKLVIDLDIVKNVTFLGNINNGQKNYLFKKTNLMVMPTTDESNERSVEGFGISYLEAAFYGIPSIASNVGGTPEAVLHNNTGIIISNVYELDSVLKNILSDNNNLKKLGENAKIRAEKNFVWSHIIKKYIKIINKFDKKN